MAFTWQLASCTHTVMTHEHGGFHSLGMGRSVTLKDQVIDAAMLGEYFPKTGPLADILGIGIIGLVFQSCLGNDQF